MEKGKSDALLSIQDIHKSFGSNEVLKGVNIDLNAGEVIALIGGNGAGKSTLMKIIMGIYQADEGEISINGKPVDLSKSKLALEQGIYLVPQEPMLFPNMTVEENVGMGFKESKGKMHQKIVEMIEFLGWNLKLERKANTLSIAEQQLVEILKGLLRNSRILILDEPTSSLSFSEVESLFKIVEDLKKKNIGMFYITHRLTEVFQIATHVAIMRDGKISLSGEVSEFDRSHLVKALLPPDTELKKMDSSYEVNYKDAAPVFEVKNFAGWGFNNLNFEVYAGEILGVAGVVGAGRTEFATTIFGRDKVKDGKVLLNGKDITGLNTKKILDKGVNYVPEDRFLNGIFKIREVGWNVSSAQLRNMSKLFLNRKSEKELADEYIKEFRIKVTGQDQVIGSLSGGNQQKVVIARALSTNPKVVILDEPTRGIDAGARGDVYSIISQLKQKGVAVILISSDLEEIVELSDRAIVMYQGQINCTFVKDKITLDNLTAASFGVYEEGK